MAASFKKVQILSTNNEPFFTQINDLVFAANEASYLQDLKKYIVAHGFKPNEKSEFEFALSGLAWVSSQWDHDGMNEPPKGARAIDILQLVHNKKEKFRCVEYGTVLTEVLQSYGFVTRKLALRSKDSAYGGFGQGHVAMEVWLNDLGKWIFLDGQFGTYLTLPGHREPLNYFEVFTEKSKGKWDDLEVHFVNAKDASKKAASDYKEFLKNYFGHIAVTSKKDAPTISLKLESKDSPISFQGTAVDNIIFTADAKVMYPAMNRVAITLKYQGEAPNFPKLIQELNIKSDEDFKKNMGRFAAEPKFTASLFKSGPWFDHFEYRTSSGSAWKKLKGTTVDWDATAKKSRFEARAVNSFGRPGPITFIEIGYE